MNPVFLARRRAEEFNSMVEQTTGPSDTRYSELPALVGLVTSLRETPAPVMRAEFAADLRSRLMVAAETALAPDTSAQLAARKAPAQRKTARERRIAAAVGGFALLTAGSSMAVAAQSALPGDTLYPLKRALENVHEGIIRDADDRGATMLDNASGRLDEVTELSRTDDPDAATLSQTLADFTTQASEASTLLLNEYAEHGSSASIEELRAFAAASLDALDQLAGIVPDEVRAQLLEASRVLAEIDAQAQRACPACIDLPLRQVADAIPALVPPVEDVVLPEVQHPVQKHDKKPTGKPDKHTPPATDETPDEAPDETPEESPDNPTLPGSNDAGDNGGPRHGNGGTDDNPLGSILTGQNQLPGIGELLTGTLDGTDDAVDGLLGGK